jgi:hypothetical protein
MLSSNPTIKDFLHWLDHKVATTPQGMATFYDNSCNCICGQFRREGNWDVSYNKIASLKYNGRPLYCILIEACDRNNTPMQDSTGLPTIGATWEQIAAELKR